VSLGFIGLDPVYGGSVPKHEELAARAVDRLPELERLVFAYAIYEKLEDSEIAVMLDLAKEEVETLRAEATRKVSDAHQGENLRPMAERTLAARFVDFASDRARCKQHSRSKLVNQGSGTRVALGGSANPQIAAISRLSGT
jgi:hypothetical protein